MLHLQPELHRTTNKNNEKTNTGSDPNERRFISSRFISSATRRHWLDVDVDVVDLRAQADASMPASNNNVKLYNISNF